MDLFDQLKDAEKDRKKRVSTNASVAAVLRSPRIQNLKVRIERNRTVDTADENGREKRKRSSDSDGNLPEAKHPRREQVSNEAPQSVDVSPRKPVATPATNASPMAPKIRSCYVRVNRMKVSLLQTSPSRRGRKKRDTPVSSPKHKEIDLKRRYGKRWFRCHVRIPRCRQPDASASIKAKTTSKNLSVSFSDEVEICGKKASDSESELISNHLSFSGKTDRDLDTRTPTPSHLSLNFSSSESFSPSKNTGSPKMDKMDIGTPERDTGTSEKDSGTPKKDGGTPKKDIDTPEKDSGSPKKVVRSPKMHIASPKKDIGTPKNTTTITVTSDTVDSVPAKEEDPVEPNEEEMNGLMALKAYEEDEDEKEDAPDVNEEHRDKVDITTVAEIHQNPGGDDDKAKDAILNGDSNDEDEVEKIEDPSLVAKTTTEETNCEDITSGDELAPQADESKEPSFQEILQDDIPLPVTFDDNSSGSFASAEGQAHLNDDDSAIEKIRSFIDEKSNTEDNRIHDNEVPDLSMLTGEHQYTALTAKSRPALHTFENRFSVLEDVGGGDEQASETIRLCVEEGSNISEDVAVQESNLNPPAILLEDDECRKALSLIETMVGEQQGEKEQEQEPMLLSD